MTRRRMIARVRGGLTMWNSNIVDWITIFRCRSTVYPEKKVSEFDRWFDCSVISEEGRKFARTEKGVGGYGDCGCRFRVLEIVKFQV